MYDKMLWNLSRDSMEARQRLPSPGRGRSITAEAAASRPTTRTHHPPAPHRHSLAQAACLSFALWNIYLRIIYSSTKWLWVNICLSTSQILIWN